MPHHRRMGGDGHGARSAGCAADDAGLLRYAISDEHGGVAAAACMERITGGLIGVTRHIIGQKIAQGPG